MTDMPTHPRGQWMRQRRTELGLNTQVVSKALGLSSQLSPIELYDLFIPPEWGKVLHELKITEVDTWPEAETGMRGRHLRDWRKRVFVRDNYLADVLRVHHVALQLVEGRDWPVPPEWQPALQKLMAIAPNPAPRAQPSWDVRNRVVPRVKEGVPIEKVASTSGMEVEVVRLWVHLENMREQMACGFPAEAPPSREESPPAETPTPREEPTPEAGEPSLPDPTSSPAADTYLRVPLGESQMRALGLLAQVFPGRSAGALAGAVVGQFLKDQSSTLRGLERVANLGGKDPRRFEDPAEVLRVQVEEPARDEAEVTIQTRTVSGVTRAVEDLFNCGNDWDPLYPGVRKLSIVVEAATDGYITLSDIFPSGNQPSQPRDVPVALNLPSSVVEALGRLAGSAGGKTLEDVVEAGCRCIIAKARYEIGVGDAIDAD